MRGFKKKAEFYEKVEGRKHKWPVMVSPYVDEKVCEAAGHAPGRRDLHGNLGRL